MIRHNSDDRLDQGLIDAKALIQRRTGGLQIILTADVLDARTGARRRNLENSNHRTFGIPILAFGISIRIGRNQAVFHSGFRFETA